MINRLVAENFLKVPFKGQPYFTNNNKVVVFKTDSSIRIKSFNKDIKDIDIIINNNIKEYIFAQNVPNLLLIHNQSKTLEIYQIKNDMPKQTSALKIAAIQNVEKFKQNNQGLIIVCTNNNIKQLQFSLLLEVKDNILKIDALKLKQIMPTIQSSSTIISHPSSNIIALMKKDAEKPQQNNNIAQIYAKNQSKIYQKIYTLNCLKNILGIYRNRFIINQKNQKQIQFYDINEYKMIGSIIIDGIIKYSQIKQNLLVVISNKQNTDYCNFLVLSNQNNFNKGLISHKAAYQKGKGDFYQFSNLSQTQVNYIIDKKGNNDLKSSKIIDINQETYSILYILNKSKQKVEMIKIDHSKLIKSPFKEQKLNIPVDVIRSKKNQSVEIKKQTKKQNRQIKQQKKQNFTDLSEQHKKFIQSMIQIKMKKVQKKFQQLEKRVTSLQKQLQDLQKNIEQKVKVNFNNQNADYLQKVYDNLTPQLQKYFAGMFKQVAGVVENGVTFYNSKIAKEAQIHKNALSEIVDEKYRIAEDIINGTKKQTNHQKNEESLASLLEKKKKWMRQTDEFQKQTKDMPMANLKSANLNGNDIKPAAQSKVFVRADLNYNTIKKES